MKAKKVYSKKSIIRRFMDNKELHYYCFYAIVVFIAMLFSATNCSPLVGKIGEDSGMYLLMGRNMIEGGSLYIDLFDHKGPIIFFLNAIPQLFIHGATGVWILEIIFMFLSCIALFKCGFKLIGNNAALLPPLAYILFVCSYFNGGNYTEEYSNLFVILSLYIFICWVKNGYKPLSKKNAFLLGIYFAVVFFLRPNNVAIIAVIVAFIGIYSIIKDRKSILKYFIFGLLGIGVVSGLIVIYHIYKGSLYEMFYATVLHNLSYCKEGVSNTSLLNDLFSSFKKKVFLLTAIVIISIIKCFVHRDRVFGWFLIFSYVITVFGILISGREFMYYLVLLVPVICLSIILFFYHGTDQLEKYLKKRIIWITGIVSVIILIFLCEDNNVSKLRRDKKNYKYEARELVSYIPDDEKNELFGYDTPAVWFYLNEITPCYRYFTMQHWMAKTNPKIDDDIVSYVKENKPKWIVTYYSKAMNNEELSKIIISDYEFIWKNQTGYLYKLIE